MGVSFHKPGVGLTAQARRDGVAQGSDVTQGYLTLGAET